MNETAAGVLAQAARVMSQVAFAGASADEVLRRESGQGAAVRAISLGSLRWYWRLKATLDVLLADTRVTPPVRSLLLVALHQLEYSRNPPETTVSSAVDAVRLLQQPRAAGLVNALLRRFLREREAVLARALTDDAAAAAHPRWLFDRLQAQWPAHWPAIVESDNAHPPMTLRVNLSRGTRAQYQERLREHGLESQALEWSPSALVLRQPVGVTALPGFAAGEVSVQDAGAQLASALLDAQPGDHVLDACAAPGGKTGSILERTADVRVTAVDLDAARASRVGENLTRIGVQARVLSADLGRDLSWWDGRRFERILLDVPCSATGVIRRHPDIKLLRQAQDIPAFVQTQRRLLAQCLTLLSPGGRLLYATCSLFGEENQQVIQDTLKAVPSARPMPLPSAVVLPPQSLPLEHALQLLPGNAAQTDGFYYACLTVT